MKVYVPLTEAECHCGLQFADQEALIIHVNADHSGGVWKCSEPGCPKLYSKASSVRTHFKVRHSQQFRHYCEHCSYGHDEIAALKKHKHVRYGILSDIICDNCGKVFSQKNKLQRHVELCGVKGKPFKCTEKGCTAGFRSKNTLQNHLKTKHSDTGCSQALCLQCG